MNSNFDIVIYGATGFTGRLVAEYLHKQYGNTPQLSWAMAGRSREKFDSVCEELGLPADTPFIQADLSDESSLQKMVDSSKLVLTTVGPYQLYGSKLVELCANSGTDYVDLCGESVWMRQMIDANEAAAKASGSRIVFSCGFDSIPSDLGVFRLQNLAIEKTGEPIQVVNGRVRSMNGTFSGGTAASFQASMAAAKEDPENYKLAIDPFALVPDYDGVPQPLGNEVAYDENLSSWTTPFIMAAINTRNVHRSNALLGFPYGKDFVYDEMVLTGDGDQGKAIAEKLASSKGMGGKDGPKPGEGPSKEEREAGNFDILYVGKCNDGSQLGVSVSGDKDPGYGSTSKMISEAAICLLQDATETPGGIWTTAPAMGDKLIARLEASAGLKFTLV